MPESYSSYRSRSPQVAAVPFVYTSHGIRSSGQIQTKTCNLITLSGLNHTGTDAVLQLFEQFPVMGSVPVWVVAVPKGQSFHWVPALGGRVFSPRLYYAISSDVSTYTPVGSGGFWLDAEGQAL